MSNRIYGTASAQVIKWCSVSEALAAESGSRVDVTGTCTTDNVHTFLEGGDGNLIQMKFHDCSAPDDLNGKKVGFKRVRRVDNGIMAYKETPIVTDLCELPEDAFE